MASPVVSAEFLPMMPRILAASFMLLFVDGGASAGCNVDAKEGLRCSVPFLSAHLNEELPKRNQTTSTKMVLLKEPCGPPSCPKCLLELLVSEIQGQKIRVKTWTISSGSTTPSLLDNWCEHAARECHIYLAHVSKTFYLNDEQEVTTCNAFATGVPQILSWNPAFSREAAQSVSISKFDACLPHISRIKPKFAVLEKRFSTLTLK